MHTKSILFFFTFLFIFADLTAQIQYVNKKDNLGLVTDITHAGDGSNRVFVASQSGIVTILDPNNNYATLGTLLNISSLIASGGEKGLLGLAFHPDFETNGYFFVNYNPVTPAGNNYTVIARFTAAVPSAHTTVLNSTQKTILTITAAANSNHKSGDLAFGPDGYLYIPTGDGGGGGDPQGSGQNGNTFLGKILRLDINTTSPYLIPATNPFVTNANVLDEIWDLGLRNPWRISFDRQTNDLWIADVGQGNREEINFEASGSTGGYNYGWNCREGFAALNGCANSASFTAPVFDYSHCSSPCSTAGFGNSVTGGFVYRGTKPSNSAMVGYYIFADYVYRHAWMIKYTSGSLTDTKTIASFTSSGITSFGELENGELMVGRADGSIGTIESTECGGNQSPTISISSPASSYIRGTSFTINSTVGDPDGTPVKVEFYNNNVLLGTDLLAPFSHTVSPADAASYSITAKVFDDCGQSTTSSALIITTTVSCFDGVKNGDETGVDCGGSCISCIQPCPAPFLLSQGKAATQSSNYNGTLLASLAVDGITSSTNYCHTNIELQPWWQVDLGVDYQVSTIEISNRADCCGNRIKRFRVFVSNTNSFPAYATAGFIYEYNNASGLSNGQVINIPNINVIGRYVRIWVDNTGYGNNYLHLSEVKVTGCCQNNQAPGVSISTGSPSYVQGSSFTVNATANDPGGSINAVEFYNGSTLLSTDNTAPYSHTITPASANSYNLTAKATDNCNSVTTSSALIITTTTACDDGFQNGTETGLDCGGSCPPCSTQSCTTSTNISQGKTATQSTTYSATYPASRAIDGNLTNFNHTNIELQPWWQVDLGPNHMVSSIEITGRTDCCGDRIKRFRVFVSNTEIASYSNSGSIYQFNNASGMSNGQVISIPNINLNGRYVRIWVDNTGYGNNYLHFAEVKVMGCINTGDPCLNNQNPTISISTNAASYPQGSSFTVNATANDPGGAINGVEFYNGITLLGTDNNPPYSYTIAPATASSYNITAKAIDNCNAATTSSALLITTTIACNDGYQNGSETGVDCGGSCSACAQGCVTPVNLSQGRIATQSSTYSASYTASKAVDGITSNSNFNHTNIELQPWWQVDLAASYQLSSIEITNRKDCCGNRIKRFRVFVSPTNSFPAYSTAGFIYEYNNAAGLSNGQVISIPNINLNGRYIRIWVDNTGYGNNYLHLAEVKVMGCAAPAALVSEEPKGFLSSQAFNSGVRLFPNPARDMIYFRFDNQPGSDALARIYDLQGRLMVEEKLTDNKIDIARLAAGSYVVRIQSNGYTSMNKIVKM